MSSAPAPMPRRQRWNPPRPAPGPPSGFVQTTTILRLAEDPDGAEHGILDENPGLADYYRESPEAALDLLRLIREATKER